MASIAVANGACSPDETAPTPDVKLATTEFTVPNNGGTETLSIETNVPLEVKSADESWCTVAKASGQSKTVLQYTITIKANEATTSRETELTISATGYSGKVVIKQMAGDLITVTNEVKTYECENTAGEFTVTLQSTGTFSVNYDCLWISPTETTGTSVKFSVLTNFGAERTETIQFTCGNSTAKFVVKQKAGQSTWSAEEAIAVAHSLGLGWNLGNQLDANNGTVSSETVWGNPVTTQAAFYKIAAAGITTVRIPVTWLGHFGAAPDYKINAAWMNRVSEVVGYAENAGLKAVINIFHDGGSSQHWLNIKDAATNATLNTQIKAQIKAMWTQIAEKFKDKGDFLIFEGFNEIHDGKWGWGANLTDGGKQYTVLNEWVQVFVNAVRATGGNNTNRYLSVPGYVTNPELTIKYLKLPTDIVANRLIVAVHYYAPTDYTLEAKFSEWGHTAASDKKDSYGDEASMRDIFSKLKVKFVDNGIPVYIGEFGCVHRSTERAEAFRKYYLEYLCKAAKDYGLAPFYWDNGSPDAGRECSGLLNHGTGDYLNNGKEIIDLMVKGATNEDAAYTLESIYNGAPQ
jgi:aryl-phospho-beta-D-glucosidase BglC (GH1 family)